ALQHARELLRWLSRSARSNAGLPVFGREPAKLKQPRLLGMQFQAKLQEALLQFHQESLGIRAMLESYNEVICETHYDYVAVCPLLPPLLNPQIEHIVEISVRQQGRQASPL